MAEMYRHPLTERKILALLLRSKSAAVRMIPRLRKEFFSVKEFRQLLPVIEKYWSQYQTSPKKSACLAALKATGMKERELDKYDLIIDKMYNTDIDKSDDKFYVDKVIEAWKARKILRMIENSMDMVEQGKIINSIEHIQSEIAKLQLTGNSVIQEGHYLDSFEKRLKIIQDRIEHPDVYRGVPTGIHQFDEYYGGLMDSELGIVVGGSGRGKSIVLMNYAVAAWLKGHDVIIFTIEMSKQEYEFRIDSRLAGIMHRKFRTGNFEDGEIEKWKEKIQRLRDKRKNSLLIIDTPQGCTTDFIEYTLMKYKDQLKKPLVIVDYLNIMFSKNASRYQSDWESQGNIARELKANICRSWNVPLWTAAQPNREGQRKKNIDNEDIGRSLGIIENANFVLGLVQTKEEELDGTMRLMCAKGRDGKMPQVLLHPDLERMRINIHWGKDDAEKKKE